MAAPLGSSSRARTQSVCAGSATASQRPALIHAPARASLFPWRWRMLRLRSRVPFMGRSYGLLRLDSRSPPRSCGSVRPPGGSTRGPDTDEGRVVNRTAELWWPVDDEIGGVSGEPGAQAGA